MKGWIALALAVTSGLLLALSLPPHDWEWLGWVALAPLLLSVRQHSGTEAAGLGLVTAVTCGAVHVPWSPGAYGIEYAVFPFLLLALLLCLIARLGVWARRRWEGAAWFLLMASAGVALEWCTLFAPIPLHLALCQHRSTSVIQMASVTGIWGVSFLVWLANALAADVLVQRRVRKSHSFAALAMMGWILVSPVITQPPRGDVIRVAAIQDYAGAEGGVYGLKSGASEEPGDREALTRQAVSERAQLVVWPELGLGNAFAPDSPADDTVALARELGIHLVVGYSESGKPKGYNAAALITPDGAVAGVHRKNYPFLGERRDTAAGREATAFNTPLARVGIAICFDTCYPELPRRLLRSGARIIAMPNYDPVTPRGIVHRLHGAVLPFRAVETRTPIVRSDANGMSQVIDVTGEVLAEAPLYRPGIAAASVGLGNGEGTPFTRLGDWVAYVCLAVVVGFGMAAWFGRKAGGTKGGGIWEFLQPIPGKEAGDEAYGQDHPARAPREGLPKFVDAGRGPQGTAPCGPPEPG